MSNAQSDAEMMATIRAEFEKYPYGTFQTLEQREFLIRKQREYASEYARMSDAEKAAYDAANENDY